MTPGLWIVSVVVYLIVGIYPTIWLNRWTHNDDGVIAFIAWFFWAFFIVYVPIGFAVGALIDGVGAIGKLFLPDDR